MYSIHSNNSCINNTPFSFILLEKGCVHNLFTHAFVVMGYTPLVVKSDSMAPTFCAGDLIFIKKCDTSTLKEGDIICFHTIIDNEYALNTHRIQKIDEVGDARSYTTLGDNNHGVTDTHIISDGDIVGKYVGHLKNAGKVMDFLSSSIGFLVVIVLPMLLFFIYQVYNLIMISIRLKKAVAVETAKEEALAREKAAQAAAAENKAAEDKAADEAEAAKAALEEAKRLREEAEAIRAKAEKELAEAKNQQNQPEQKDSPEEDASGHKAEQEDTES